MWRRMQRLDTMVLVYTGCIFFNHLAYGITTNINPGPTMVDYIYVYNSTVKAMSYLASMMSSGYMLGSLSKCARETNITENITHLLT